MEHKPFEEEDEDGLDEQASLMTWNVLPRALRQDSHNMLLCLKCLHDVLVALFGLSSLRCM